ncbi:MAG: hypothetical protein K9N05_07635 [Candidatus Marinimicrobia bacterium]|nr:hypothetical protein [Candidatus Neomarinimicrobiota bacterium]
MAASCLIIQKNDGDRKRFEAIRSSAESLINKHLGEYFKSIKYSSPDENSFLIQFIKDDTENFLSDDRGWIHIEGTVFSLKETKLHNIQSLWDTYQKSANIDDFANSLDGHFVIKIHDMNKRAYFVINDFIKDKTQYYTENDDCFFYSTFSYLSALVNKPIIDKNAVNEFMWRYYVLTERSLLENTYRMMPASVHEISSDRVDINPYWAWPRSFSDRSFKDQVEDAKENMSETARLLGENFKVHLDFTQGQDCRQNIAAFLEQKQDFSTSIFGKEGFEEVKNTAEIASRYNIEHHRIVLEDDYLEYPLKHFDRAIYLGSGEEPGHQLGRILYMREKQGQFGNAVCNGMDGHFYKNGLWDEMYTFNFYREPKSLPVNMFLDLRMLSQDYSDDIFSDEIKQIKKNSRNYFYALITGSVKGMENSPISMQVDKFDLSHWLNFTLVANSASNTLINAFSPLLFRRNLELALRVPVKWKFNLSKFQRALVHGLHPELAAEPTDFSGVNMKPKNFITYIPFILKYSWHQSGRLRNKILRKIGFHPKTHLQEAWDYSAVYKTLYSQIIRENRAKIINMKIKDILNQEHWINFVDNITMDNEKLSTYEYFFKIMSLDKYYQIAEDIFSGLKK